MNRTISYTLSKEHEGLTVGEFLKKHGFTRHIQAHMKRTDHGICINHEPIYTNHRITAGELLTLRMIEEESSEKIPAVNIPIHIIYEDDDILVLNKPYDMPVHPSLGNYENTLANGVAWYYQQQGIPFVFRCINRLDRDTTGLLILAKNMLSGAILSDQMKQRKIERTYLALVSGIPEQSQGTINEPIARVPGSVLERCVSPDGDIAITHYKVLESFSDFSLVEFHLETGRTHQIRVHMKYLGHPLLGDFLYNPEDTRCSRQTLHSASLKFSHPITGKMLFFHAPLPDDMAAIMEQN